MTHPQSPRRIPPAALALALTAIALLAGGAARSFASPVQELLKLDLGISDSQVALLQGAGFAIPAALLSIPLGRWVDRSNRARLLQMLTLVGGVAGVIVAFAHDFGTMMIGRMLVGAAVAGAAPAALSLVADLAPADKRGKMLAIVALGQVAGQSLTFAAVGALLAQADALAAVPGFGGIAPWRAAQLVFALGMFAVAAALLLLKEPARLEAGAAMGAGLKQVLAEIWSLRSLLFPLMFGLTAILMADTAAVIWAVPVLTRFLHQQPADFGSWMGLALLVSGIGGVIVGGWVADIGQRRRGRSGVLIGATQACAVSIPAAMFPLCQDVTLFAILFSLTMFTGAAVGIMASTAISVLFPNELRGLCVTLLTAVATLLSYGVAPSLVTLIASFTESGEDIRMPLVAVGVLTSMVGTLAFWYAQSRTSRHTA